MKYLLDYSLNELKELLESMGEKPFRAGQLYSWLTQCASFEQMSNLSKPLREKLRAEYLEGYPEVLERLYSRDGTQKFLLELRDDNVVECVLMQYMYGKTLCISTQAGCAMGCAFCASTRGGLRRNLTAGEILGQVLRVNALLGGGRSITNVVLMGTGEPLANYDSVVKFLRLLHQKESLGVSMRNISLSTCGLVPEIYRFAKEGFQATLCLSLHSAIQQKREEIMPIAKKYALPQVIEAMHEYGKSSGRRVIYEYILIAGFNDTKRDLDALADLLSGQNCHINLIPCNQTDGRFVAPSQGRVSHFLEELKKRSLSATVRRTLGEDIEGACGQLRARYLGMQGGF